VSSGLSGVRVVDFGHYIAGPLAALLLAEAGADVVHVDSPEYQGDPGPLDGWLNRSKRRVGLDLASGSDRSTARELVRRADVVVENFRPGVMDRLGLGAEELRAADEALIYCSLPGFGSDDEKASIQGWEGIVHAAVAGYRPLKEHWDPSGRNKATVSDPSAPMFTPITTASNFGGLMGTIAVVMALLVRERSGCGQRIEIPLAEAFAEAYSTMLGHRVYAPAESSPALMLNDLTYRCSDGGLIDLSPYPKFVIPLLVEAGVADDWESQGLIDVSAMSFTAWRRDEIAEKFADLARSQPAAWWDEVAARTKMPVSMVRTPAEWMATGHAAKSGTVVTVDDPIFGSQLMPGRGFDMSEVPWQPQPRHLPNQDRATVLAELRSEPAGRFARATRASVTSALELCTVIDVTQAVAGPTATRLLADFGAHVIKVGSPVPAVTDAIVGQLHRGKRTILMDVKSTDGGRLMTDLLRRADVLVTNFTPDSQARYGIDYQRVQLLNSQLVHCSISAYGQSGPWAHRGGYENRCNAATGMSWRYGGRFGWTLYQPTPINDADTGLLGAFAVAVALYARSNGGAGQEVAASLAQGSTLHQGVHLVVEAQSENGGYDAVRNEYGMSALYRVYPAADRWIFLAGRKRDLAAVLDVVGVAGTAEASTWRDPSGPLASTLSRLIARESAGEWIRRLGEAGVTAHVACSIDEAIGYLAGRGLVYFDSGVDGEAVARPGIGDWLSGTPPRVRPNPGAIGSQAVEILRRPWPV
jgi:crotonobetainyl-CoA:carnitine CoA-transferase CaiB-like acyl-CoA transferase